MSTLYPKQLTHLTEAFQGNPHHAWIFEGPKGVGKRAFAQHFCSLLLSNFLAPAVEETAKKIRCNTHPNFLYVEPEPDTQYITVDQVRAVREFVQKTATDDSWKTILIDSLNTMNANASNALLKTLEEPRPRTAFFLLAHQGTPIVPTLRSRCLHLTFYPPLAEEETCALRAIAANRPGILEILEVPSMRTLVEELLTLLKNPSFDYVTLHTFARSTSKNKEGFYIFQETIFWWLNHLIKATAGGCFPLVNLFNNWKGLSLSKAFEIQASISHLLHKQKAVALDPLHTILSVFFMLNACIAKSL